MRTKVNWKLLAVRIPVEVNRALKVRAAAVVVEGLVRQYLVGERKAEAGRLADWHKKHGLDSVAVTVARRRRI